MEVEKENASGVGQVNAVEEARAALEGKISHLEEDDRILKSLYKKASKDIKEKLDKHSTDADKVKFLHSRLMDKIHDYNKLERSMATQQRAADAAKQEKEAALGQLEKSNKLRVKLEALCKQLQKTNSEVVLDAKLKEEEARDRSKEMSDKFSVSIKDIQEKIETQDGERMKQHEENEKLREQLKSFLSQYDTRESAFEKQISAKDLERQLAELKLQQSEELCAKAIASAEAYRSRLDEVTAIDKKQKEQLDMYSDKFKDFQETLTKSNEVFASYKKESDKLHKRLKAADKEAQQATLKATKEAKARAEAQQALEQARKELASVNKAKVAMEGLCRKLTDERGELREVVKGLTGKEAGVKGGDGGEGGEGGGAAGGEEGAEAVGGGAGGAGGEGGGGGEAGDGEKKE